MLIGRLQRENNVVCSLISHGRLLQIACDAAYLFAGVQKLHTRDFSCKKDPAHIRDDGKIDNRLFEDTNEKERVDEMVGRSISRRDGLKPI